MRFSEKNMHAQAGDKGVFGIDFHDFIESQQNSNTFELASEFGITIRDVRKLKKRLERS